MFDDILGKRSDRKKTIEVQCPRCGKKYQVFGKLAKIIEDGNKICASCDIKKLTKERLSLQRHTFFKNIAEVQPMMDNWLTPTTLPDECPHCGSKNIEPVEPFDYIKRCNDCQREFTTGEHN